MASLFDRIRQGLPTSGPLASPLLQRVLLGLIVVLAVSFPLVVQTPPLDLPEGVPAPRTVRAPRSVQYVDEAATAKARAEASNAVEPVLAYDPEVVTSAEEQVAGFFDLAAQARAKATGLTPADAEAISSAVEERLADAYPQFDEALITVASQMSAEDLEAARGRAVSLVRTVLSERISDADLSQAAERVARDVEALPQNAPQKRLLNAVVVDALAPTLVVDEQATQAARDAAANEVEAVVVARQAGENIVVEGEVVTAQALEIIKRLGLLDQSGSTASLVALVCIVALMIAGVGGYIWRYDAKVWGSMRSLLVMASLFVGMIWLTRVVLWWRPDVSIYVLPVPLAAMLATLLISAREGLLVAVLSSLAAVMLGFATGDTVAATMAWSIAAVIGVSFMTERRRLFYVGTALVAVGAFVGLVGTIATGAPVAEAVKAAGFGAIGGMLASVLCYGLLPFFEHIFGITTDVRLLELANPSQPLLRELMTTAPGTYSHSVMTGNLAEAGAEAVGAHALLARVGAYYHDVGKMRRPGFFIENQAGGVNPHDETAPSLSAIIITSHVKEGMELARDAGLPEEVVDIIHQHHGTSLVSYFYNKASEGDTPVYEADFRYDGERPQTQEAALVMLADSCEAAVRAIKKPTTSRIDAAVRGVIDNKVADGQLDEAGLTLAQIELVKQTYARMLASVYHPRVEYPSTLPRRSEHAEHPAHQS